ERAALHIRAAHLRHARGADAPTVAHHLVEADRPRGSAPAALPGPAGDHLRTPWAVTVLSEAAEHALLDDRHERAANCPRSPPRPACAGRTAARRPTAPGRPPAPASPTPSGTSTRRPPPAT